MNRTLEFLLSAVYGAGSLVPDHRENLATSDTSEPLRVEQGIRSVPPADFDGLLGFPVPASVRSLMLFPYPAIGGGWTDFFQVKVFPPPPDGPKRAAKYLQPRRSGSRLYFVRRVLPDVLDPSRELVICEGVKKTLRGARLGLPVVGIAGIQNWHTRGTLRLLADFDAVPLAGRAVRFIPDGDVRTNPRVERAAAEFAAALEARGAQVRIVLLPPGAKLDELVAA